MIETLIILCSISPVLCDLSLLILHTNDMHSRYEQVNRHMGRCNKGEANNCYGGFARLHETVKRFKKEAEAAGRSTLFLNAGDTFQGTPYHSEYKWEIASKMINTLDIDAMTLGNHEFDDGVTSLASFIDNVDVPIICSNLDVSQVPSLHHPNLYSSKVLEVKGTKVGIVGYLTPTTLETLPPGSDLINLKISEEISSIREEARKLKDKGVQIIIALGHSGYDKDLEVALAVEDIDVVVGGHTHTFLYSGTEKPDIEDPRGEYPTVVTQESGKQVPVVQAYFGTKYLGYLEVDFDNKGNLKSYSGAPKLLNGLFPEDPDVLSVLEPYKVELGKKLNVIVGSTTVILDNSNGKCSLSECEIGNLITDAFTDYMKSQCSPHTVSAGLINAGGIRSSLGVVSGGKNSDITVGDIKTVLPFGAPVVLLNLLGKILLEVLEHAVSRYKYTKTSHVTSFLQVSGLRVTYDTAREVGKQVTHVEVLCPNSAVPQFEPLKEEGIYGVVVDAYLAKGGDGFLKLADITKECISNDVDYAIVAKYIQKYSPITPRIEGRIKINKITE